MAAYRKLLVYQGDSYLHEVIVKEEDEIVDISDRSYASQIRETPEGEIIKEFAVDMSDATDGVVRFTLTPEETTEIATGTYLYDVQQTFEDTVLTFLTGPVIINRQITRD